MPRAARRGAAPARPGARRQGAGHAGHLVSDVIAHNAFVPDHEARMLRVPHVTHALAEWAMDRHISRELFAGPTAVLQAERETVVDFVVRAFRCDEALARRAIGLLARADGVLRASRLPSLCRGAVRLLDAQSAARFDAYLRDALTALQGLELALSGELQDWISAAPDGNAIAISC